ncbi:MAG: class I tRNA ligase family protein, partial [Phycisphaerae bacterium]
QDAHATHGQDAHATHGQDAHATHGQDARATLADKWILSRLAATIRDATAAIDGYRFNELADTLYHFVWDDFCDWYLEIAKGRINAGEAGPKAVLAHCLDTTLRLLHPIMPFVTEAIWQNLNAVAPSRGPSNEPAEPMLIRARWPVADSAAIDQAAERDFDMLRDLVRGIRNSRTEHAVPPGRKVKVIVEAAGRAGEVLLKDHANIEMMKSQAGLDEVRLVAVGTIAPALVRNAAAVASGGVQAYVLDIIDRDAELARLTRQRDTLARGIKSIEGKLSNEGFLKKAPPELAAKERARMEGLKADLAAVEKALDALK